MPAAILTCLLADAFITTFAMPTYATVFFSLIFIAVCRRRRQAIFAISRYFRHARYLHALPLR